ncbi:MAG TPA: hypothetical protein VET26_12390 [Candidatus Sulfotelmatobacter sp.]|nr:hypothetical protein [Candidatus Sulfotelmatobacter sp.]
MVSDRLTIAELGAHHDDDSGPLRPDKPKRCVSCNGYHGPVGELIRCLEVAVVNLRAELRAARGT